MLCGHMVLAEVVIAVPVIPPPQRMPSGSPSVRRVVSHGLVIKHFDLIAQYLAHGAGWETVARQLRSTGSTVSKHTLKKYYEIEQKLRCGDEKKTKKTKTAAGG